MTFRDVEMLCHRLSPYQIRTLWPHTGYSGVPVGSHIFDCGPALLYWCADWLMGTGIIDQDRLRLWVTTFGPTVIKAGNELIHRRVKVKIGFLDRSVAVMDGCEMFLCLDTGDVVPAINNLVPLETLNYDLGALWTRYYTAIGVTGPDLIRANKLPEPK